jgi:hypothetical protein
MALNKDVDVICLDLDHCLARYRIHALQRMIYACLCRGIVEQCGAPSAAFLLASPFARGVPLPEDAVEGVSDFTGEGGEGLDVTDVGAWGLGWAPHFCRKGLVLDGARGDVLQLGPEGQVLGAFHGFQALSPSQVALRYGAVYWGFELLQAQQRSGEFLQLTTYFDTPAAVSFAQWVEHEDAARQLAAAAPALAQAGSSEGAAAGSSPPSAGYTHLLTGHIRVFNHIFDNDAAFPTGRGGFFAALRMHPSLYIASRQAAACALQALRASGHPARICVVTNSSPIFARFMLRAALGPSYASLFHALVYCSAKPLWFSASASASPPPMTPLEGAADGKEFLGGTARALCERLACGGRGLFAGDHVVTDVVAAAQCPVGAWTTVAVVEELDAAAQEGGGWAVQGPWGDYRATYFTGTLLSKHATLITSDVTEVLQALAAQG